MRRIAFVVVGTLSIAVSVGAAPVRQRVNMPEPELPPPIELDKIAPNNGAVYGDWVFWRYDDGGRSIMFVNQKTKMLVYLTFASNGWVNYRTGGGAWHVLFPSGGPSLQNRDDLQANRFKDKMPSHSLASGKVIIQNWTITITPESVEMFCPSVRSQIIVRPHAAEFVHNNRVIGDGGMKSP